MQILRLVFETTGATCMDSGWSAEQGFATEREHHPPTQPSEQHTRGDDHDGQAAPAAKSPSRRSRDILLPWIITLRRRKKSRFPSTSRLTAAVGKPAFFGWATSI